MALFFWLRKSFLLQLCFPPSKSVIPYVDTFYSSATRLFSPRMIKACVKWLSIDVAVLAIQFGERMSASLIKCTVSSNGEEHRWRYLMIGSCFGPSGICFIVKIMHDRHVVNALYYRLWVCSCSQWRGAYRPDCSPKFIRTLGFWVKFFRKLNF
jgi:hypothetical protein